MTARSAKRVWRSQRYTLDNMQQLARKCGGHCLSETYRRVTATMPPSDQRVDEH